MTNRILPIVAISAISILGVACSQVSASSVGQSPAVSSRSAVAQGNDRGNGGNSLPRKSSLLQVQSVLVKFQERAATKGSCDVYKFGEDWKFAKNLAHRSAIKDASDNACELFEDLVKENRILIQAAECKDTHSGAPRDGSVSEPSLKGTVCISTDRLQTIPPGELKVQIVGLLLHEIMHLLGYPEELAVYVQEYYLRDVSSEEYWSPQYGKTPLQMRTRFSESAKPAEIQQYLESAMVGFERNRDYFNHFGIACVDAAGVARSWKSFNDFLIQPDSLTRVGLPPDVKNFNQADHVALNSLRMRTQAVVYGLSKGLPGGLPDLSNNPEWVAKLKLINDIVDSTYEQFESAYPASTLQLSVCEAALIRGRSTLRVRLEEERHSRIQEQLQFD